MLDLYQRLVTSVKVVSRCIWPFAWCA